MPELLRAAARHVMTPIADSRRWDAFEPREGDIIIGTFAKVGTTWTQRIVDLLVHQSPEIRPFGSISPWLDATVFDPLDEVLATLKAQAHRRYIKSHLPFDALPVWREVRYIHVGRPGLDARLSWQNHAQGMNPELVGKVVANAIRMAAESGQAPTPPAPVPEDSGEFLRQWLDDLETALETPGGLVETYFGFEETYWRERTRENLLFVHYDDLKADLAGEMRRISEFLGIDTPGALLPALAEAARFDSMKKQGGALFPGLDQMFDRGADRFIHKGESGRGRAYLSDADAARYEAIVARAATPGLGRWLAGGRRVAGDPRDSAD